MGCNTEKRTTYSKLIRDKIPEIIEGVGKTCKCETLPEEGFIEFLNAKLIEEVNEYLDSGTLEELADITEVIHAILEHMNVHSEELQRVRLNKRSTHGGFEKRLLLKEVIEQ